MALAAGLLGSALAGHKASASYLLMGCWGTPSPLVLSLVGLGAALVKGGGAAVGATVQSRLAQNIANEVRLNIVKKLLRDGGAVPPSELTARFAVRIAELERSVRDGLLGAIRALLQLVPLAAGLVVISPRLAIGATLLLVPFALLSSLTRQLWRSAHDNAQRAAEGAHQQIEDLVQNIDLWRTYGAGVRILDALGRLGSRGAELASRVEGARAALSSGNEVLGAAALAVAVWAGGAMSRPIATETLLVFAAVFFMMYRPLRDLGEARVALLAGATAMEALRDGVTVKEPPRQADYRNWSCGTLLVDGLGVQREGGRVMRTSFVVEPGEIVVLVGPTGSGKTTLLRALLGLESDVVGHVTYAGFDITHAPVGPTFRPFAWAPQRPAVLLGSLEDNLRIACPEGAGSCEHFGPRWDQVRVGTNAEPREDDTPGVPRTSNVSVREAGCVTGRDGFATDGFATAGAISDVLALLGAERLTASVRDELLGSGGRAVSGGEEKWIALGRALASRQPVLLLDEPTAGLDQEARGQVLDGIARLRGKRSVVLVTHEVEPLRIADRVVSLGQNTPSPCRTPRGMPTQVEA